MLKRRTVLIVLAMIVTTATISAQPEAAAQITAAAEPVAQVQPCHEPAPEQQEDGASEIVEEPKYYDAPLSEHLQDVVIEMAGKYAVPETLLFGVMKVESEFAIDAISSTGDYGIMQINQVNHAWLAQQYEINDIMDPAQNIKAGAIMLGIAYSQAEGDISKALMIYNMGAGGAKKKFEQGIFETEYSRKVLAAIAGMKKPAVQKAQLVRKSGESDQATS